MANDRVYMICKKCGDNKLLFKYYPTGSYFWPGVKADTCNEFLNEHLINCHNTGLTLRGDPGFVLVTESELFDEYVSVNTAKRRMLERIQEVMNERQSKQSGQGSPDNGSSSEG